MANRTAPARGYFAALVAIIALIYGLVFLGGWYSSNIWGTAGTVLMSLIIAPHRDERVTGGGE